MAGAAVCDGLGAEGIGAVSDSYKRNAGGWHEARAGSEKWFRRKGHKRWRRLTKKMLGQRDWLWQMDLAQGDGGGWERWEGYPLLEALPALREAADVWAMPKDGRAWFGGERVRK